MIVGQMNHLWKYILSIRFEDYADLKRVKVRNQNNINISRIQYERKTKWKQNTLIRL
jgi:hypothetical protein